MVFNLQVWAAYLLGGFDFNYASDVTNFVMRRLLAVGIFLGFIWLVFHGRSSSFSSTEPSGNSEESSLTFHGYPCTEDCSGHEAGYNWAEEHGIDDEDRCENASQSFEEGCKAYVEENGSSEEMSQEDEDRTIDAEDPD